MNLAKYIFVLLPIFANCDNYPLSSMEKKSVEMANSWLNNNSKIIKQKDGSLGFMYGDNMPTVLCKPSNATYIKLGNDEVYKSLRTGDSERWEFDVVEKATGGRTYILIKPKKTNIMTNLIIFTNSRIYNIKLISSNKNWTPSVSFIYPNDENNEIDENLPKKPQTKEVKKPSKAITSKSKYEINSSGSWMPKNIFTKKGKTYINIEGSDIKSIRLYSLNNTSKTIKYKYANKHIIVNGILKKAILVKDGFGKTIVKIRRK